MTSANPSPTSTPRVAFWTDAPPKKDNAPGIQGIARHFADVLQGKALLLMTRRFSRNNSVKSIREAGGISDVLLTPDTTLFGLRRISQNLAVFTEQILFALYLPILAWKLKRRKISRIFVLCGADGWLIPQIRLFQKFVGIPLDLYLVDDIEDWIAHTPGHPLGGMIHGLLREALRSANRVFAISPGFKDHLSGRFGVDVEWLPLPSSAPPPAYFAQPESVESHSLTFLGGPNYLYEDSLRDIYSAISHLNDTEGGLGGKPLILEILTLADSAEFEKTLPHTRWLRVRRGLSNEDRLVCLRSALACLLPYSFLERERLMVTTSFSCKILDYFVAGRPIVAYGPPYASVPRYFVENHWPLCAGTREELLSTIRRISESDNPQLIQLYTATWQRWHSAEAIKKILAY